MNRNTGESPFRFEPLGSHRAVVRGWTGRAPQAKGNVPMPAAGCNPRTIPARGKSA